MAYEESEVFVKIKNGVKAPKGFHYMPNGKLMSDADHIAMYGYLEQEIKFIGISTNDLSPLGEQRTITISGDNNAVFSLEIIKSDGTYYDFKTQLFVAGVRKLNKQKVGGSYGVTVKFPAASSVTYEVNVIAECVWNIKTKHAAFVDARNADNSININQTLGSNSTVLTRKIFQDPLRDLIVSCIAPSLYHTSTGTVNGATSSTNRIVLDQSLANQNLYRIGDKITGTGIAASVHALVTKLNPDNDNVNELEMSVTDSATNDDTLTFTPPFNGMTPHFSQSTTGADTLSFASGSSNTSTFTLTLAAPTGRTLNVIRVPNTSDLCTTLPVNIGSAAIALEGEDTSSDSVFFRWPVNNIAGLAEGMSLDPSRSDPTNDGGTNTTTPAIISSYQTTVSNQVIVEGDFENEINTVNSIDVSVAGVDSYGNAITTIDRNGRITAQAGNLIFNVQQADALKSDSTVAIYAHGNVAIKQMTGMDVNISNVTVTTSQVSTTTSGAVSASTTIGLAEVGNISAGMTVRGVGISAAAANPTVVSKSTTSGAGNIVVSAAQTLESGQTLFFDGATNQVVIKGTMQISEMAIINQKIYFDVERFISAS